MKKLPHLTLYVSATVVVLLVAAVTGVFIYHQRQQVIPPPRPKAPVVMAYGIRLDSLTVTYSAVKQNENLSAILSSSLEPAAMEALVKKSAPVFDVRKLKAGNRYARIVTKDSTRALQYFIYEINPIDYVVYDVRDSVKVFRARKKVTRMVKTATGTINSSLWNCFVENRLDMNLGLALSDVYAWTIDFYGLQKGDCFKVIYEELFVDNKMIGIDRILASKFIHNGKDFYAFYFEQEGKKAYFDEFGQSLERSFLKAPLKFSRISSRFSRSRMHPILRIARPHYGVDYAAPKGTPVLALGNGRISEAGYKGGYGRFISIRHNSVYTTTYAHLAGYAQGIRAGVNVSQGQVIGFVGSSGLATGPHLDFRVYKNGSPSDPLKLESPPSRPVDPKEMQDYLAVVDRMKASLEK